MNTKTILGISFAAVFAVSMLAFPLSANAGGHPGVDNSVVEGDVAVVIADGVIPTDGSAGLFGYAFSGDKGFLGLTSHGGAFDSVGQVDADDASFHTHFVTVDGSGGGCSAGVLVTSASKSEAGGVTVLDNVLAITDIPKGKFGELSDAAFSFTLVPEGVGLCLVPDAP